MFWTEFFPKYFLLPTTRPTPFHKKIQVLLIFPKAYHYKSKKLGLFCTQLSPIKNDLPTIILIEQKFKCAAFIMQNSTYIWNVIFTKHWGKFPSYPTAQSGKKLHSFWNAPIYKAPTHPTAQSKPVFVFRKIKQKKSRFFNIAIFKKNSPAFK